MNVPVSPASLAIIILAAGKGKRMNMPDMPKVMAQMDGTPLIGHVLRAVEPLNPEHIIVVVGHHKEIVTDYVKKEFGNYIRFAEQKEQLGTGHAVMQAMPFLSEFLGTVLILTGDTPLITTTTLLSFTEEFERYKAVLYAATLSATTDNPFGYGRIIRTESDEFMGIVEEKDATPEQKEIQEINTGIFLVRAQALSQALDEIQNDNAQGEYYLTDIIRILRSHNATVMAVKAADFSEFQGINTIQELEKAEDIYQERKSRFQV
jgi:UDP-N-acetylglucosamine diphosphorylase/glucosamine-1-phosphate N-acetyltransferase